MEETELRERLAYIAERTAELMECSASTVNTQTSRGLERLRASVAAPATVREERW